MHHLRISKIQLICELIEQKILSRQKYPMKEKGFVRLKVRGASNFSRSLRAHIQLFINNFFIGRGKRHFTRKKKKEKTGFQIEILASEYRRRPKIKKKLQSFQ